MPVPSPLNPPDGADELDSVIRNLTVSLKNYSRIANHDMSASKADLLLSQLRRERLRALTAVAKTHALLAEMELLVVHKQLEALKSIPRSPDSKLLVKPSLRKLSVNPKKSAKSDIKKAKQGTRRSPLHKIDTKSKAIAKTTLSNNSSCVTCVSSLAKSLNSLQIKKQNNTEILNGPTEIRVVEKILDSCSAVLETSTITKQDSKIDVSSPCTLQVDVVSNENIQGSRNEDASDFVGSTSPFAQKIFGIANYNVTQQEEVSHWNKNSPCRKPVVAPKRNLIKKAKKLYKELQNSQKGSLPLKNISDKENNIKPRKSVTKDTREKVKAQRVEDTPVVKASQPLPFENANREHNRQTTSITSTIQTKEHPSLKVSLPLPSNYNKTEKSSKKSPMVEYNRGEKEKQQKSHYRETKHNSSVTISMPFNEVNNAEKVEGANELSFKGTKETGPPSIKVSLSTIKKNIAELQKQENTTKPITVESKKEQREYEKEKRAPAVRVRVSLPLTRSNLAIFNKSQLNTQCEQGAITKKNQRQKNSNKKVTNKMPAPPFKVSIPLNYCAIPDVRKNPVTRVNENLNKPECGTDERRESQKDQYNLLAWKNINWDAWDTHQRSNEKTNRAEVGKQSQYTWQGGPMRKVSWAMFTRRLCMTSSLEEPCPDPPTKKICLGQDNITSEPMKQPTQPATVETRVEESLQQETSDLYIATNDVFKQIMIKKENAERQDDARSIMSDQTALLCTTCQCIHETKVCPNRKYFKFLGI